MTTATITIKTHCFAAELVWDKEKAELFHQMMIRSFGRDCICHEDEYCWLAAAALKGIMVAA